MTPSKKGFKLIQEKARERSSFRGENTYRKFLRFLGNPISYLFYKLGLSANTCTFVGFLIELAACGFLITSHYIIAFLLLYLGVVFDYADGTLARMRNEVGTMRVSLLCSSHHFIIPTFVIASGFINYYFIVKNPLILILGIIAGISSAITFHIFAIKSMALYKYAPKVAEKQNIDVLKGTYSSIFMKVGTILFALPITFIYLVPILFLIEPLIFIVIYSLWMPSRLILAYVNTYFNLKKTEKKLKL